MRSLVSVFFDPPMAIARVGASATPLVAFRWAHAKDAHGGPQTVVEPELSFEVDPTGAIRPFFPSEIRFKDSDGCIRPVAPFFELWVRLRRSSDGEIDECRLTLGVLRELGIGIDHLALEVTASNLKAARRTGDPACGFTARIELRGDDHQERPLDAFSPHTSGRKPLVLQTNPIPLGKVQWIRPIVGEAEGVDLAALRLRFTPAKGEVYGPPEAAYGQDRQTVTGPLDVLEFSRTEEGRVHMIVKPANRILSGSTIFSQYQMTNGLFEDPQPQDGYDGADEGDSTAWGVVDDTCDALITATVAWRGERYLAHARVFVGPPQYAPDRRPFYDVISDLEDRDQPSIDEFKKISFEALKDRVVDLFRRVFEFASSLNLDAARTEALQNNLDKIGGDTPTQGGLPAIDATSMTRGDTPFVDRLPDLTPGQEASVFTTSVRGDHLSYTEVTPFVHGQLMDEATLLDFLRRRHDHVRRLLRPPFGLLSQWDERPGPIPATDFRDPRVLRDVLHDMRMPPYLRDAYYVPLSLTRRQYHMMIAFLDRLVDPEVMRKDDHE